jgi:tRNA-splicing ligase RtcB
MKSPPRGLQSDEKVNLWLAEPLPAEVRQSLEQLLAAEDVQRMAVMPDVHLSNHVCVGVAIATERLIYPEAVGGDIGCGMAAVRFDLAAEELSGESAAARLLAGLYRRVPAMRHSRMTVRDTLPTALQQAPLSDARLEKLKHRDGRMQFGTLGRGNHFLEFQSDSEGAVWLMVHSGSRGMGQAITSHHLAAAAQAREGGPRQLARIAADSDEGRAYLSDVAWAINYAEQNRVQMVLATAQILGEMFDATMMPESLIHGNHNHVRREEHAGKLYWVHRKGALSAAEGELGVIPGSMGRSSFHVAGRGDEAALRSSSHGAGRALRRGDAARTISGKQLQREMQGIWFDQRQTDRLRDEAPSVYKDVRAVMRAQRELTRIVRELRPVLSYKAGGA